MPNSHRFHWEIARHLNAFKLCGTYLFAEKQIESALEMYIGL